ncbi:MAG: four helix bundle protein [Patescibacteria group bacterium]
MSTSITKSYRDLIVWRKSVDLSVLVYELTEHFPRDERYALTSQVRRAVVSIPSNIAEGRSRSTKKDFCNFLHIALGSAAELETQIEIAKRISKTEVLSYKVVESLLTEVMKMLHSLISKLEART